MTIINGKAEAIKQDIKRETSVVESRKWLTRGP